MSLNRTEQRVFDYLQTHPEERHFWMEKVRAAGALLDPHVAATQLADALWSYYEERSGVVPAFREIAAREGMQRTSMRNLSEHLLRLWTTPRPRRRPPEGDRGVVRL